MRNRTAARQRTKGLSGIFAALSPTAAATAFAMPLPDFDPARYAAQLDEKCARFKQDFAGLGLPDPLVFASASSGYRLRAEFRIWHHGGRIDYAMFDPESPRSPVLIDAFPPVAARIAKAMPVLRDAVMADPLLLRKLFQVEFLSTLSGELMVSLVYHRPLDASWDDAARTVAALLDAQVIGRSRGQKRVLARDWVLESFELEGRVLQYQQIEGSFTQPNGGVNRHMLRWARGVAASAGGDLLELYCGNGNFTVALAPLFGRVLATEVSKSSVGAAAYNLDANQVSNVTLVRMSSDEISDAMAGGRVYRRMRDVDLSAYRFTTLFVDPPRGGLDETTTRMARGFERVLYISCNPRTLLRDVAALSDTHSIQAAAAFDQFPYTDHLECGLLLVRKP